MSWSLAPVPSVKDIRDHHHEVQLSILINFMYNMSILGFPEAQDGDWEDVGVPGASAVSQRRPGPSP